MIDKLGRNDACWCGSGQKYKKCHAYIDDMLEKYIAKGYITPTRDLLKTKPQIDKIKESCKINIEVLDFIGNHIAEGITTEEIDRLVFNTTKELGGKPATLNYKGFPRSVCTSINEQVCHGIPSEKTILKDGDIINVDVSTKYNGYFSDSSRMYCIGNVSNEKKRLVKVAKECMELGIKQVRPWSFLGDIGQVVSDHAKKNGYSVVREIGGHGIGLQFHEDPWVNYVSNAGTGMLLVPGLIFTVEPMINMGTAKIFIDKNNDWTFYTADGKPSAQWESMVLVTNDGCEVLTY
jgi:methionyl aminopeptidase